MVFVIPRKKSVPFAEFLIFHSEVGNGTEPRVKMSSECFSLSLNGLEWVSKSIFFHLMVRNEILSLLQNGSKRNSELFNLPRNGSKQNSDRFPFHKSRRNYNGMNKNFHLFRVPRNKNVLVWLAVPWYTGKVRGVAISTMNPNFYTVLYCNGVIQCCAGCSSSDPIIW